MSKYIFLDFDGVLNSTNFLRSQRFIDETSGLTDAELYLTQYSYMLDREAIELVNDLVVRSGAIVIASTSHRIRYSLQEMDVMLARRGATFQFSDKTPRLFPKKFSIPVDRGDEIQAFLDQLPEPPEGFVILDDMNNMLHLSDHLVLTGTLTGLKSHHIEKAIKILNGDLT